MESEEPQSRRTGLPGSGVSTSVPGMRSLSSALSDSTAGGSPWTRSTFFGFSLHAYSISARRVAWPEKSKHSTRHLSG